VKQEWEYYSVWSTEHKEYGKTDDSGYASFPQRSVRVCIFELTLSALMEIASGLHYGMGSHARIWAHGTDPKVWTFTPCTFKEPARPQISLKNWSTEIYP